MQKDILFNTLGLLTGFPTPTWPLCLNSFSVNLTTSADTEAFSLDLIIRYPTFMVASIFLAFWS